MSGAAPGDLLGKRYRLLREIGRGGHGVVWYARDLENDDEVAIKVLKREIADTDQQYAVRLWREAQSLAALWGTAVVKVHAFDYDEEGNVYMVMELLQGEDLDTHLIDLENFDGRMSIYAMLTALDPVAKALHLGHFKGIIHRDVKPSNIFLVDPDRGGGTRLMDFGLAKIYDAEEITEVGMIAGSPSYIAPEVWNSRPFDHRIDVYSFAAVIFRALTGHPPFRADSTYELFEAVCNSPRPNITDQRHDLPVDVDEWVHRALALAPEDRYADVTTMWNEFTDICLRGDSPSVAKAREAFRLPSFDVDDL